MKNIIIVGYPKSGNTWITRLVSELIGCPKGGFLGNINKIVEDNTENDSEFKCFKSHLELHELKTENTDSTDEIYIIYVIRDPRDIVISGAGYFRIHRWQWLKNMYNKLWNGKILYNSIYNILSPESYCISRMLKAVLYGSEDINPYC